MREGADAIVVGAVTSRAACEAIVDAVAGGHLVLATIASPTAAAAFDELVARLPAARREGARALLAEHHLGSVAVRGRGFEIVPGARSP
jgi:Tfp pilus assembly pilus retraction ATPase PilT